AGMPRGMDRRRGAGGIDPDDRPGRSVPSGPLGISTGRSVAPPAPPGGGPPAGFGPIRPPGGGPPFGGGPGGIIWNEQMPEEGTGNLVELSVYGIASIYERYPPKPATADAGAPAATPGAVTPVAPPAGTPATPPVNTPPARPPPP